MPDYLPQGDLEFNAWQINFMTYASANLVALGLVAGDLAPLTAAQTKWSDALVAHSDAQAAAAAARANKDDFKSEFIALIRPLVRRLQASSAVSDGERSALGITVPGANPSPGGPPAGTPLLKVHCDRLMQTVSWVDSSTPTKKSKPPGVAGLELRMALTTQGEATPTDVTTFQFMAIDSATPYTVEFAPADGGKNAHFIGRWVNSSGQHGPWSETVSMTVSV